MRQSALLVAAASVRPCYRSLAKVAVGDAGFSMADPAGAADTGTGTRTVEASDDATAAADTAASDAVLAEPAAEPSEPAETAVAAAKTEADAAAALLKKRLRMVSSLRILHRSAAVSALVPVPIHGRLW